MITQKDIDKVTTLCTEMMENGSEYDPDLAGAEYLDFCPEFSEVFEVICNGLKAEEVPEDDKTSVTSISKGLVLYHKVFDDPEKAVEYFTNQVTHLTTNYGTGSVGNMEKYIDQGYYMIAERSVYIGPPPSTTGIR